MNTLIILLVIYTLKTELTFGQALTTKYYTQSTLYECVDPCSDEARSLLECIYKCALSDGCLGVSVNLENGACCECSNIGVAKQTNNTVYSMYRIIKDTNDSSCTQDIVDDVPDSSLTASSSWGNSTVPSRARLNTDAKDPLSGAWSPASYSIPTEYIQVRFHTVKEIVGVATQGRNGHSPSQYVKSYLVEYSVDCVNFSYSKTDENVPMVFPGNTDRDTVVWNDLSDSILAVCVRIIPMSFESHPSLRFGIKGCDV